MRAKRSLGQNFLRDDSVIKRIVEALDIRADDTVVEIGPGQGALTTLLVERASRVIAIEFDRDLIAPLRVQFHGNGNLKLVNADALTFNFGELNTFGASIKLVANLPYNISTPILQHLIDHRHLFERLVLMFQREVIDRIAAIPATRERGFLSVIIQECFDLERLFDVPPTAFRPVPKVWSSVVRLRPRPSDVGDTTEFRSLISRAFAQKRKTLANNLRGFPGFHPEIGNEIGIDMIRRAETLTNEEWLALERAFRTTATQGF